MDISRELAIVILKYLDAHRDSQPPFYFPFLVMNQEYSPEDDDFVEIEPAEWSMIEADDNYQTFQLWENLQDLRADTTHLLAKGFIEEITGVSARESFAKYLADQAKEYRSYWKAELWESENIEEYGFNEYIGGKAEAYEDCLGVFKKNHLIL